MDYGPCLQNDWYVGHDFVCFGAPGGSKKENKEEFGFPYRQTFHFSTWQDRLIGHLVLGHSKNSELHSQKMLPMCLAAQIKSALKTPGWHYGAISCLLDGRIWSILRPWAKKSCSFGASVQNHFTADSKKLEHVCRLIYAGFPSFCGLGLEDGHVPTFCLLLWESDLSTFRVNQGCNWKSYD